MCILKHLDKSVRVIKYMRSNPYKLKMLYYKFLSFYQKTKKIKRKRSNVNSKAKPKKMTEEIGGSNKGHNGGKPDAKSRKKGSRGMYL